MKRAHGNSSNKINSELHQQRMTLQAHRKVRPEPVVEPLAPNPGESNELSAKQRERQQIQETIEILRRDTDELRKALTSVDSLKTRLKILQQTFAQNTLQWENDLRRLQLSVDDIVVLQVNSEVLQNMEATLKAKSERRADTILQQEKALAVLVEQISMVTEKLDGPAKAYQAYMVQEEKWALRRQEIIGAPDQPNTICGLRLARAQLKKDVPLQLEYLRSSRIAVVHRIFQELLASKDTFAQYVEPIQAYARQHQDVLGPLGLSFDVQINESGFASTFLSYINQSMKGAFHGTDQALSTVKTLIANANFDNEKDATDFAEAVLDKLETAIDTSPRSSVDVHSQLRQGRTTVEVYDYVLGLTYLQPVFHLQMHHKDLPTLSPGERGALLLAFYLLLDPSTIPLVIDQPEENLDNQSVYEFLVPCIKAAKAKRQIIISHFGAPR